ncbi:XK-related protein 6 [Drosophila serrata]|uniref:XK-related protein 6 n=1 Tax=Drosophila serrata TaxID=7274 RepID=UPI000A1CF602|nr:XK-related protein 6 [Drosophila serrata]
MWELPNLRDFSSPGVTMMIATEVRGNVEVDGSTVMEPISTATLVLTGASIVWRFISIFINWSLAYEYWMDETYAYCAWTVGSILVPMVVTSAIYIHILIASHSGQKRITGRGVYTNAAISYLFRDAYALNYALEYTRAKERDDKPSEIRYYQKLMTEECNVGFVRLFDSFLESAPQKVLQLVIVLRSAKELTYYRLFAFIVYFGSIAWCIQAYNRSNRLVQLDKHDIAARGRFIQFIFLLCFTVSRTICIAYMASVFPLETVAFCAVHACLCGSVVFVVDSPTIAMSRFINYLYCLCFGVVYLFIYTPLKDGPTKYKYAIYLTFCLLQNVIACVLYIPLYVAIAITALYIVGIVLLIFYYSSCHPSIVPTYL